jgi:PAS domain S-box-containing protein
MEYDALTKDELIAKLREAHAALSARGETAAHHERLLHELHVHQLELEAQNQTLRDTQDELEESHRRYVDLYDFAPIAYCTFDRDGVVLETNLTGAAMLGRERSRIVGKPILALVRLDQPDTFARHLRDCLASESSVTCEISFTTEHGTVEVQLTSTAVRGAGGTRTACRTALLDITQRRAVERVAQLAAERLTSAVESVQDAFALFDASDHLVLCNSAYRHLLGDSLRDAVVGRSYVELLDAWIGTLAFSDDRERELFRSARLAQRHAPGAAFDVQARDGRRLRVMDRRTPEGGLVKTIWDLTADMQREEQLKQARASADSANAAKNEFLASMSHELRTPLNAILGFAQLLEQDKKEALSARHKERVKHILKGGEHLLRLISDILNLSRIEVGGLSMSLEPVSIADVVDEVRRALEPAASSAGLHMEFDVLDATTIVRVDRTRLAQILLNFGSNAIKYNRSTGTVRIRVSFPDPEHVRVTVADTGFGIPLDQQAKLFQAFHRAGQQTGPIEGTGIGLAISKRLAELMQGSVGFRSVPSEGSEFWVELRIHAEHSQTMPRPAVQEPTHLTQDRRGVVLYVEDNPANIRLMRDLLEVFEGIELMTAPTAEIGVELARSSAPSVIIMDINLPGMSGLDALRILKGAPETERVPVIALTAAASEQERKRGERLGFYRYMTKPVDIGDLEATLEAVLSGQRKPSAAHAASSE